MTTALATQYAPAAPDWIYTVILVVGITILAAVTVGSVVGALARIVRRRDLEALAVQAADHGEPSREAVEQAAVDALAQAEAQRAMQAEGEAAFLDAMCAGRPHLRLIREAQEAARTVDAEWERIQRNGWLA